MLDNTCGLEKISFMDSFLDTIMLRCILRIKNICPLECRWVDCYTIYAIWLEELRRYIPMWHEYGLKRIPIQNGLIFENFKIFLEFHEKISILTSYWILNYLWNYFDNFYLSFQISENYTKIYFSDSLIDFYVLY